VIWNVDEEKHLTLGRCPNSGGAYERPGKQNLSPKLLQKPEQTVLKPTITVFIPLNIMVAL